MTSFEQILQQVAEYYTERINTHGATAKGADWKSAESQELRFQQLLKICEGDQEFSIVDYGCGYGQLATYMMAKGRAFRYIGLDVSEEMISNARQRLGQSKGIEFNVGCTTEEMCDYVVASGIFNVKQNITAENWQRYIEYVLHDMHAHSRKGMAFNCLTTYSDSEHMRSDLYYANPCLIFDYCKRTLSRDVALLHDYGLYEFTVLVRKVSGSTI